MGAVGDCPSHDVRRAVRRVVHPVTVQAIGAAAGVQGVGCGRKGEESDSQRDDKALARLGGLHAPSLAAFSIDRQSLDFGMGCCGRRVHPVPTIDVTPDRDVLLTSDHLATSRSEDAVGPLPSTASAAAGTTSSRGQPADRPRPARRASGYRATSRPGSTGAKAVGRQGS
jgi:hypothetical protein